MRSKMLPVFAALLLGAAALAVAPSASAQVAFRGTFPLPHGAISVGVGAPAPYYSGYYAPGYCDSDYYTSYYPSSSYYPSYSYYAPGYYYRPHRRYYRTYVRPYYPHRYYYRHRRW